MKSFVLLLIVLSSSAQIVLAQNNDSVKVKTPKHYFNTCFYYNSYRRLEAKVFNPLNRPLTYSFKQINTGFYTPVLTRDWFNSETQENSNLHILLTGNLLIAQPTLTYVAKISSFHKFSIGVRGIYNSKNKNVWFADLTPFSARDRDSRNNNQLRISGVLLYSRLVNENLSFKFGVYKTYLFGNNRYLPIIGFRIGRLDGVNFQFQFPRNMSLNLPINKNAQLSFFVKGIGGQYTYRKKNFNDSTNNAPPTMVFNRFEALSGALFNFNLGKNFSLFLSSGFSTRSQIGFGAPRRDFEPRPADRPIRDFKVAPSIFINGGFSVKFGKVKSAYHNTGVYESYDLNKSFDPGDNNMGPADSQVPNKPKVEKVSKNLGFEDVKDFITADDLN